MTAWPGTIIRAVHLRLWRNRFVEHPGWIGRHGRIYPNGYTTGVQALGTHHTAQPQFVTDASALGHLFRNTIGNGYLAKTGHMYSLCEGPSYTQGKGGGGSPLRGNGDHWSLEIGNDGIGERYTDDQVDYLLTVVPALIEAFANEYNYMPVGPAIDWWRMPGHFEWSPGRKVDPAGPSPWSPNGGMWNMDAFRADIGRRLPSLATPDRPTYDTKRVDDMDYITPEPQRLVDTRKGTKLPAAGPHKLKIPKHHLRCVNACRIVVGVIRPNDGGWLAVRATGTEVPSFSSMNYTGGMVTSGQIDTLAHTDDTIQIWLSNAAHYYVDLVAIA
jgi:hypothetical protein